jgi:dihydrolipoamide dehydrogenase
MTTFDLIIIGGGPAGYVGAIRAAQLGMKTAVIEKEKMGGMCLNWGCIPSKAFIESAKLFKKIADAKSFGIDGIDKKALKFNWKKAAKRKDRIVMRLVKGVEYLMKKNGVEMINGEAKILDKEHVMVGDTKYTCDKMLIATGSRPLRAEYKNIDQKKIMEIDEFFALEEKPECILVDGGRINACEMALMLRYTGSKVTMVTESDSLIPFLDEEIRKFVMDKIKKAGITVYTGAEITKDAEDGVYVGEDYVECDVILNAKRRRAVLPEMGELELERNGHFLQINEYMQTSAPNVYAAGDVTKQFFAQVASAQALTAVNHMNDIKETLDYNKLPVNIYTDPEIAYVGYNEEQLKEKGIDYKVGKFPLSVNGKAMIEGETEGFVKVLSETKYGEVMGVHIVAADATDMIAEAVMAMRLESTVDELARVVHAHPTISETFMEASYVAADRPVHI